jgi:hypothetical protein
MSPSDAAGGKSFWALSILLLTGAIGRYFYSYVPRAANGRELELEEVKVQLSQVSEEWDQGQRRFRDAVRREVHELIESKQWRGTFFGRVLALLGVQIGLRRALKRLAQGGRDEGVPEADIDETMRLARAAHHTALMVAHYEDLRAILNFWRYLHRWVALLLVILVVVHIVHAMTYGAIRTGGGG